MSERAWVKGARWEKRGTELIANAAIGATVLSVDWAGHFDDGEGESPVAMMLELDGTPLEYVDSDEDAGTITLAAPLTTAASEGDTVYAMQGGEVQVDYIASFTQGEEGEDGDVFIPFEQRPLWPEGEYDEPVEVLLDDALERIVEVPGKTPAITETQIVNSPITSGAIVETSITEGFSGTSLPAGWTSEITSTDGTGSPTGALPGVSVIASGAPAGVVGSALLVDYGPSGQDWTTLAGAGHVDTGITALDATVSLRYRMAVNASGLFTDANLYIFQRTAGTPHAADGDGIFLDLSLSTPTITSRTNNSDAVLAYLPALTNVSTEWHQVRFQIAGGVVQAKVWREGDTEPGWTSAPLSGTTAAGSVEVLWREFPFSLNSTGQRAYIDSFDVTIHSPKFLLNDDGTGSWPSVLQAGRALCDVAVAGTTYTRAITFATPFPQPPVVHVQAEGITNLTSAFPVVVATDVTTTGFTLRWTRSSTASFTATWQAIGVTQ